MGGNFSLEEIRAALADDKQHISVAQVMSLEPSIDLTILRCKVKLLPDEVEMIATMTFDKVGKGGGSFQFPEKGDLVLVVFADGNPDFCFIVRFLTNSEDKIPLRALLGHTVNMSIPGKKNCLASDTKITIGRGGLIEESEPLVLGNVLKSALDDFMTRLDTTLGDIAAGPMCIDSMGSSCPTHPVLLVKLQATKAQLLIDVTKYLTVALTNILSQIAVTER
jgi:hypothetical protein